MPVITCKLLEPFYITGTIEMELSVTEIQGNQAKLCLKTGKKSYASNKKIKRGKSRKTTD